MARLVINERISLDGVIQAPARPDEDVRGGFEHGGWAVPYADDVMGREMAKGMPNAGSMLFGRRTFEQFATVWPHMPADNQYAKVLNEEKKYVVSRTLEQTPSWNNTELLRGEAVASVQHLKERETKDIVIIGSGELVRSLMLAGLIDVYQLLVHPIVLGTGTRLFPGEGAHAGLKLVDSVVTTTGVIIATYVPA
jgi:dihydrofolate reductase